MRHRLELLSVSAQRASLQDNCECSMRYHAVVVYCAIVYGGPYQSISQSIYGGIRLGLRPVAHRTKPNPRVLRASIHADPLPNLINLQQDLSTC